MKWAQFQREPNSSVKARSKQNETRRLVYVTSNNAFRAFAANCNAECSSTPYCRRAPGQVGRISAPISSACCEKIVGVEAETAAPRLYRKRVRKQRLWRATIESNFFVSLCRWRRIRGPFAELCDWRAAGL